MKFSQLYCPTVKEVPKDAEVISHQLMIRSGLIRKVAAGLYSYLPLGYRIIRKFENIVREEMNRAGGQEVHLPSIIPSELWQESERWDKYGRELLRIKDRHDKDFCYGPTHEEVITDLIRHEVKSYKQLPLNLYQIQTKFRDEIRPRFGVMRSREFAMKDAYSFHASWECLNNTYQEMENTYKRIFERCELTYKIVEADSGAIGGDKSAEFMVTAQSGEDAISECDTCSYAANVEAAKTIPPQTKPDTSNIQPIETIHTPNLASIKEVAEHLNQTEDKFIKTLVYLADDKPILVLVRGDHSINEIKLNKVLNCNTLNLADETTIKTVTQANVGFAGPVNINIPIYADYAIQTISSGITGANKTDYHINNVVLDRDYAVNKFADIRNSQPGDACPICHTGKLQEIRGIEVGHIFQLGTKYSKSMKSTFLDANGKSQNTIMGCYGIGIARTVAAAIEQNHDERGIQWPLALAPYHVDIILTNTKDDELIATANSLYESLNAANIEVIFDDRKESAGIKFKDAELMGIPIQIIIGKKFQETQKLEINLRHTNESFSCSIENVIEKIRKHLL